MADTEDRDEQKKTKSVLSFWAAAIIGLPVLYVLSLGPAIVLYEQFEVLRTPLEIIYYPASVFMQLIFDSGWGEPVEPLVQKYFEWWGG